MNDVTDPSAPRPDRRSMLAAAGTAALTSTLTAAHAPAAAAATRAGAAAPGPADEDAHGGDGRGRTRLVRGTILHYLKDPGETSDPRAWELFEDGVLAVDAGGRIAWAGDLPRLPRRLRHGAEWIDHRGKLIVPGFVDTHVHSSQVDCIASYGEQLMEWLQKYVFPAEAKLADREHARAVNSFFLDRLLEAGTTTASVHPTVHPQSVDAFFEEASRRRLRMLCGKVLMDREPYAPSYLRDASVAQAEQQTRELIERWHGRGRLGYSITPRFAPTSTKRMLAMAGRLYRERPDVWLQTHLAENKNEVALVKELFGGRSYLDVYDRYGLLGEKSLFAHSVHIDRTDRDRLATTGSAIGFCPTSNTFLGSGLFNLRAARARGVDVGLGTDVGGGTSYSMLQTLGEAYKVTSLRGRRLPAHRGFYLATLGGAEALDLDHVIGSFRVGKEADFTVLDWEATPVLARRTQIAKTFEERLFALMILGAEQAVSATYVLGDRAYQRP